MVRSIFAVVSGFILIGLLVVVADSVMGALFPESFPEPGTPDVPPASLLSVVMLYDLVFAVIGGFVTAHIARRSVEAHTYSLAALIIVFAAITFVTSGGAMPWWYFVIVALLGVVGAIHGGRLYLRWQSRDVASSEDEGQLP
jgi:hypothetical protein